jgi:hypothetical protein
MSPGSSEPLGIAPAQRLAVLVVDDDEHFVAALKRAGKRMRIAVDALAPGSVAPTALPEVLRSKAPNYDLVVLDHTHAEAVASGDDASPLPISVLLCGRTRLRAEEDGVLHGPGSQFAHKKFGAESLLKLALALARQRGSR